MRKLSVGVVFGSRSVEHDVSIVTAHQVMDVLASSGHKVVPIYITRDGRWLSGSGLHDLAAFQNGRWEAAGEPAWIRPQAGSGGVFIDGGRLRGARHVPLDVVIPAIHGTYGEDGTLQGLLDLADLPYTGSGVVGSAVGMDKVAMKAAFRAAGLPVVPHVLVEASRLDDDGDGVIGEVEESIGYPAFVKPARLGSSVGIGRAPDRTKLAAALDVARRYDRRILIETAMQDCIEVNCSVLGGQGRKPRVSVCEQPVAWEEFLTFSDKYLRSGKARGKAPEGMAGQARRIPAPISRALTEQIQTNAAAAFEAVDAAGVARVDSFLNERTGQSWVMEINTTPGSFSFYLWEATGLSFPDLMEELIDIAFEGQRGRSELMFSYDSGMLTNRGPKTGG
jgi:D-alanine-D-alanine ligase